MKVTDRICIVLLAVLLPVAVMCISETGVWRISDTYEYSLKESQVLDKMGAGVTEEQVSHTFTRYINDKTDEFSLTQKTGTVEEELFTEEDARFAASLKSYARYLLIAGICCLILALIAYICLRVRTRKTVVRKGFSIALGVFICMAAVNLIVRLADPLRNAVYGWLFDYPDRDGDLLTGIMNGSLPEQFAVFQTIIAVVMMLILWYISSWLTRPEKIFFRR